MKCEAEGLARIGRKLASEHPISRGLLAPMFNEREFSKGGHAITLLKGTLIEQLAGARELQKRQVILRSLGLRQKDLPAPCRNALVSLGVVRRRHRRAKRDWIAEALETLYGCKQSSNWHEVLGPEYEHALQFLIEAKARFSGAYSEWLGLQDGFNDIVIRQFFNFCKRKGLSGYSKTVGRDGKLVNYGSLIAEKTPFDTSYPSEARAFRTLHDRRSKLPGSHPYDAKGGAKNRWVTKKERDWLVPHLKCSLDGIVTVVEQNC
jgi:hypothetical protein